jgi:hypothetical protein
MIPLERYAKVNDKFCVCYFGSSTLHLAQLAGVRPFIEQELKGLVVYIGCRDDLLYVVEKEDRIVPQSQIRQRKHEFGYIRDLRCNPNDHPVEFFLTESKLDAALMFLKSNWKNF